MPHSFTPGELEAHYRYLRRVAHDLVEDDHLADDAVQTVMLQTLQRDRSSIDSLRAWSRAVLRNGIFALYRTRNRAKDREQLGARSEVFDDHSAETHLFQEEIAEAVELLREPYRTAIEMRYLREMSIGHMARELDVSVETLRTQLRRGRVMLRESLEPRYGRERFQCLLLLLVQDRRSGVPPASGTAKGFFLGAVTVATTLGAILWLTRGGERSADPVNVARSDSPRSLQQAQATRVDAATPSREVQASAATSPSPVATPDSAIPASFSVPFRLVQANGEPLAGARVVFTSDRGLELNEQPPQATSGIDGRGVMEGVSGWGALRLDEAHWLPLRGALVQGRPSTGELELVYVESREVRGVVHDAQSRPLADVRVHADVPRPKLPPKSRFKRMTWQRGPVRTNAAGRFTIQLPRFELLQLHFEARDHAPTQHWLAAEMPDDIEEPVVLRAHDSSWTARLLEPGGTPAAQGLASVGAGVVSSGPGGLIVFIDRSDERLEHQRSRNADHGEPGLTLKAASPAGYGIWHGVDLTEKQDWKLREPGYIRGTVTADGIPLPRARVWVANPTLLGNSLDFTSIESIFVGGRAFTTVAADAQGRFALPVCHDRPYLLMAEHPARPHRAQLFNVQAGQHVAFDLSQRRIHPRVSGTLLDLDDQPIAGATVSFVNVRHQRMEEGLRVGPIQGKEAARTLSDANGSFAFEHVPVVGGTLFVYGTGIVPRERLLLPDQEPTAIEIRTEPAAPVRFSMRRSAGPGELVFLDAEGHALPVWKDPAENQQHPWMQDGPKPWVFPAAKSDWRTWYTAARARTLLSPSNNGSDVRSAIALDPARSTELDPHD